MHNVAICFTGPRDATALSDLGAVKVFEAPSGEYLAAFDRKDGRYFQRISPTFKTAVAEAVEMAAGSAL